MTPIYIFYALISEEKSEGIKMHGPYIHSRPNITEEENDAVYIFDENDYNSERKFLSKFLRTRYPHRLPIFNFIKIPKSQALVTCDCGFKTSLPPDFISKDWSCKICNVVNEIKDYDQLKKKERQACMIDAQESFEKKFNQMQENFDICNKPKKNKNG